MKPLIVKKIDGGKLEIGFKALNSMLAFIQEKPYQRESGGVLVGRYIRDSSDIVVDEVTSPMWGDHRGWFNFFRSRRPHQQAIDRAWQMSGGTTTYLGEWHTHPEKIPIPSATDHNTWKRKLREDIFDGDSLYFIIIGIECLRIWELGKKSLDLELLGEFHYLKE